MWLWSPGSGVGEYECQQLTGKASRLVTKHGTVTIVWVDVLRPQGWG